MKNRQPTDILMIEGPAKGAVPYNEFDENGNLLRRVYLKPDDKPTEEGTPFVAETMLADEMAIELGLSPNTAVPNDALKAIQNLFFSVDGMKALVRIRLKLPSGAPISGATIAVSSNQKLYTTDSKGEVVVDTSTAETTITFKSDYIDLNDASATLQTPAYSLTLVELTPTINNFANITTSKLFKISSACTALHVTLVAGGGGGGSGRVMGISPMGGGGGGGGGCAVQYNVAFVPNEMMSAVVGAGGVAVNTGSGGNGGDTSFAGLTAIGGSGGKGDGASVLGGSGNGTGGNGGNGTGATAGTAGTIAGFDSYTTTVVYGGGGGGGGSNYATPSSAAPGAGYGGYGGGGTGSAGKDSYGGGGGGGTAYRASGDQIWQPGGKGGSGRVVIRMEH